MPEPDGPRSKHPMFVVRDAAKRGDISVLIEALADPDMRLSAASHLGDLKAGTAVPALLRNLRVGNDLDRNAAVIALGKIGDPRAIESLLEVARDDEAAGVRVTAIDSLVMFKDPHGLELLARLAVDPQPLLVTASRNFDSPVFGAVRGSTLRHIRRWAAKRLRQLRAVESIPLLEGSLHSAGIAHRIRLRRTIRSLRATDNARRRRTLRRNS